MGMFEGKVALVTGSARGIGRAAAELLAAGVAQVVVSDLDAQVTAQVASQIDGQVLNVTGGIQLGMAS